MSSVEYKLLYEIEKKLNYVNDCKRYVEYQKLENLE